MTAIRRLVLCLDGTWNNRDDSTNVLHHFGLTTECRDHPLGTDSVSQLKFYLEGVGTGSLDKITGGGFGFGLETNVRAAYNWLVQNFEDSTPVTPADEIYIFGFSRGAFTARSLVGFISTCGLMRRGAPLTVNQLWQNYCLLGREREHHTGPLTALFGESAPEFRRLTDLVLDPWLIGRDEIAAARETGRMPGQRVLDLNDTEELLIRWSRRVQITYLGVYDTVGAVGWDALAIPGIQSRLALHHNMRPTSLIQQCRHALALDEHRSNFRHTPFVAYIGPNPSEELGRLEAGDRSRTHTGSGTLNAANSLATAWSDRIEQRWFVGAHSNVGGGYQSNPLAQEPLKWLLEGARRAGLLCDHVSDVVRSPVGRLGTRDSFAEFAAPFWTMLLRAKRHYRPIDPMPEVRANRRGREDQPGFVLANINERVDKSVARYWERRSNPPPNLVEYARRQVARDPGSVLSAVAAMPTYHLWMGERFGHYLGLVLWATLAAAGVIVVDQVFQVWPETPPAWSLAMVAGLFALVDWAESAQTFAVAERGESPPRRAFLDAVYWMRALGVVLFLFGATGVLVYLATIGAGATSLGDALRASSPAVNYWVTISLGAGLGVGLGVVLNHVHSRSPSPSVRIIVQSAIMGPLISSAVILIATIVVFEAWWLAGNALDIQIQVSSPIETGERFAGLLLLLQLALIYFLNALSWAGRPMTRAYLGSIVRLQLRVSPQKIHDCLNRWCSMLSGQRPHKAGCRMRAIVRETLYRDIIGFIPVYSLVFTFGLWFGAWQLGWQWLQGLWLALPLTAAAADYLEDICHLRFLALHERDEHPSRLLTWTGALMTAVKLAAFCAEAILTFVIVFFATFRIHEAPELYGWRGLLVLAVTMTSTAIVVGLGVWSIVYRLSTRATRDHDAVAPSAPRPMPLQEGTRDAQYL